MNQDKNKVLLIDPPFYRLFKNTYSIHRYPLSLCYLAGMITTGTNWSVMAYNSDFSPQSEEIKVGYLAGAGFDNYLNNLRNSSGPVWEEIKSTISEYKPTVVGISANTQNFVSACKVAGFVKASNKHIIVTVGGPHPSLVGPDVMNCQDIDVCVRGEGEVTIVELLNAIENKKEFDDISGIAYRKDGQIVENPRREFVKDLDSLCFPHENAPQTLKDYEKYPITAFGHIMATRGCPYDCVFCGSQYIWSRKVRYRSPEDVIREIKKLQKMGLKTVRFEDDIFGINKKFIKELCVGMINHCSGLKWSCEIHVKLIDEQTISLMKEAGCYSIDLGIESGNNEVLRRIRKNITIEEAFSACKIIKKKGIKLKAFFIVGFPEETEDTLKDTVAAMKKIKCDHLFYSIFTPYPGTEAYELCREKGIIGDDFDISIYSHQSPANCFNLNITLERFRELASKIEKMVDRKNHLNRIKRIFSGHTLWKIQELGIGKSLKKGIKLSIGK